MINNMQMNDNNLFAYLGSLESSNSCRDPSMIRSLNPSDQLSERLHVSMTALQFSEDAEIKIQSVTHPLSE